MFDGFDINRYIAVAFGFTVLGVVLIDLLRPEKKET